MNDPRFQQIRRPSIARFTLAVATILGTLGDGVQLHAQQFGPWQLADSVDSDRLIVNTPSNDGCPHESPDGYMLFIASNRPGTLGQNDIWISMRENDGESWGPPINLGAPVNSGSMDFCPTPLTANRLVFVSNRANNCGTAEQGNNADIYFTRWHPVHGWLTPQALSCDINSGFEEFSPSIVEAEGLTLLFYSSSREAPPRHKIFMSVLQADGTFSPGQPVAELNSEDGSDARPNVRKDGLEIVFFLAAHDGDPRGWPRWQSRHGGRPELDGVDSNAAISDVSRQLRLPGIRNDSHSGARIRAR